MKVFRVFRIVDGVLIFDVFPPETAGNGGGHIVGLLTSLRAAEGHLGVGWALEIVLSDRADSPRIKMDIEPIVGASEHERSQVSPICFSELYSVQANLAMQDPAATRDPTEARLAVWTRHQAERSALVKWLWLFRDGIYSTDKPPQSYDSEEIVLRIKALHFHRDESLRRLREQVANFEAIETNTGREKTRRPLPDDVKLLVWSRDGGACVKCGSQSELHFDHIIAFARGGSDESENIQLLCRSCNLSKSDRLT